MRCFVDVEQLAAHDPNFQWAPIEQLLKMNNERLLMKGEMFESEKGALRTRA